MTRKTWVPFVLCIGATLGAGAVGALFTVESIPTWYATLVHPGWTPPNWVFGPVWTLLYILMGVSAALVWNTRKKHRDDALLFFFAHLLVNASWSIVFFGLQDPASALIIIKFLWFLIVVLMLVFWRFSRVATYLLIPYLAWVTYAAMLNLGIVFLNP